MFESGFVVNSSIPYLGASPDGKIVDPHEGRNQFGLLEIKCPYKYRNVTVAEASSQADFCLQHIDGKIQIRKTHMYFFQIQGQMALSCIPWCDFVVYTGKSLYVERIMYDPQTWDTHIFPCLQKFYFVHAIKHLCQQLTE